MVFRLTLNPAAAALLDRDVSAVRGIRIQMVENEVYIKPSFAAIGMDVAPVSMRARGGLEAYIEGSAEAALVSILSRPGTPFFSLALNEKGWLALSPWHGEEPPRNRPLIRVWFAKAPTGHSVISDYEELRKIVGSYNRVGRPPREIAEAKAKLREFDELAEIINRAKAVA